MRSRRMSAVIAAIVVAPLLALTACSSGSKDDPRPSTDMADFSSSLFSSPEVQKVLMTNWLRYTCLLDDNTVSAALKAQPYAPGRIVPPATKHDPKRSCLYNGGDVMIDTYTEKPGQSNLYRELLSVYGDSVSAHAIRDDGSMHDPYRGYWLTYHGETVGVIFNDKAIGVTVYLHVASAYKLDRKAYGHLFYEALGHLPASTN